MDTLTKSDIRAIERGVKATITSVVRSMGGDEKTGGRFLHTEKTILPYGQHRIKLRLPLHCQCAGQEPEDIAFMILKVYLECEDMPAKGGFYLRSFFSPRQPESMDT